jgi:hypothetical protein
MDRFTNVDQERVEYHRQVEHEQASAPTNEDDDLADPRDRRNREHVAYYEDASSGEWLPMALKRDDDVVCNGLPMRVVGPARDRSYFNGYYNEWFGDMLFPIAAQYIEERAPADPNETPMPLFPQPPQVMAARMDVSVVEGSGKDPKAKADRTRDDRFERMIAHLSAEQQRVLRQGLHKHRKSAP